MAWTKTKKEAMSMIKQTGIWSYSIFHNKTQEYVVSTREEKHIPRTAPQELVVYETFYKEVGSFFHEEPYYGRRHWECVPAITIPAFFDPHVAVKEPKTGDVVRVLCQNGQTRWVQLIKRMK
jgi:hypothetical protein